MPTRPPSLYSICGFGSSQARELEPPGRGLRNYNCFQRMFLCSFFPLVHLCQFEGNGQDLNIILSTTERKWPFPPQDSRSQPIAGKVNMQDLKSPIVSLSQGIKRRSASDTGGPGRAQIPDCVDVDPCQLHGCLLRIRPLALPVRTTLPATGVLQPGRKRDLGLGEGPQLGRLERTRESASADCGAPACGLATSPPHQTS